MAARRKQRTWLAALAAAAAGLSACSAQPPPGATPEALLTTNGLSTNGLSTNGLSTNGMSTNGLSTNGLSTNGLSTNGLATADFLAWFEADSAMASMVMRYIARCALPAGQHLSWEWNGASYTWYGVLGLAPGWGSGEPISGAEQQLVTACLAAHSNRFGLHVALSVRGPMSDGQSYISLDEGEEALFAKPEGCFFGNFFDGSGIYSGGFLGDWNADQTNPRGCAVEAGLPGDCPPIRHMGSCIDFCESAPPQGEGATVWKTCTVDTGSGPVTFLPLTTYLSAESVFTCGDGVCQSITESTATCPVDCPGP